MEDITKNGKGDEPEKGVDWEKLHNSAFWDNILSASESNETTEEND